MSILETITSKLSGSAAAGESGQGSAAPILELLSNQQGGISGLVEAFQQKGLGSIVSSWIGKGENLPVSAEQIQQVFGKDQIQAFAQKAGIDSETASSRLAEVLPDAVDKLTPEGEIPKGGDLMSKGLGLLQGLFSEK